MVWFLIWQSIPSTAIFLVAKTLVFPRSDPRGVRRVPPPLLVRGGTRRARRGSAPRAPLLRPRTARGHYLGGFFVFVAASAVAGSVAALSVCWVGSLADEDDGSDRFGWRLGFKGFYGLHYVYRRPWVLEFPVIQWFGLFFLKSASFDYWVVAPAFLQLQDGNPAGYYSTFETFGGETYKRVIAVGLRPLDQLASKLGECLQSSSDKKSQLSNQLRLPADIQPDPSCSELLNNFQFYTWCFRIIASLTARFHHEDRCGVAQLSGSNAAVISTLLLALLAVESLMGKNVNVQYPNTLMGSGGVIWATSSVRTRRADVGPRKKRGSLVNSQLHIVWGGDPVYPTVNYIQDPNEIADYRGLNVHEPTPNMLSYLKEHGKIISREEIDAILVEEKTEEVQQVPDLDDAMTRAIDISENDDEEDSEVEDEVAGEDEDSKLSRNWSVLKSTPQLRKSKGKPKKDGPVSLDEAVDESENLTDFLMGFDEDEA